MTFIEIVPEAEAAGAVEDMYEVDRQTFADVPNFTKAFSLRPDVYAAWRQLNGAIKANMDLRRYELATLAAARRLRSSYCTLAHGSVLMARFLEPEAVRGLVDDYRTADLEPADLAVMELADKVAYDATSVTEADVDRLRELGLTDGEILDVVLAAAARCFFSKTLDGLGVEPDAKYSELEPGLRDALTVGRPIAHP
ncbi:MAG: carboxymuconolactone decarboxylase family protein [Solirubrobacteraceae bacterium]